MSFDRIAKAIKRQTWSVLIVIFIQAAQERHEILQGLSTKPCIPKNGCLMLHKSKPAERRYPDIVDQSIIDGFGRSIVKIRCRVSQIPQGRRFECTHSFRDRIVVWAAIFSSRERLQKSFSQGGLDGGIVWVA